MRWYTWVATDQLNLCRINAGNTQAFYGTWSLPSTLLEFTTWATQRKSNYHALQTKIMITTLPCPPKVLVPDKICSSLCFEIQCTCSEISHLLRLKQVITHTTLLRSPTDMILIIWDASLPKVISSLQYIRLHYARPDCTLTKQTSSPHAEPRCNGTHTRTFDMAGVIEHSICVRRSRMALEKISPNNIYLRTMNRMQSVM